MNDLRGPQGSEDIDEIGSGEEHDCGRLTEGIRGDIAVTGKRYE